MDVNFSCEISYSDEIIKSQYFLQIFFISIIMPLLKSFPHKKVV